MTEQKIRPGAARAFYTKFLPFILDEVVKVARISYATREDIKQMNWRKNLEYSQAVADHLEFHSKVFFGLAFPAGDPRRLDLELLNDLTDMMANYLAPFFARKQPGISKKSAAAELKKSLFTDNQYIANCRMHSERLTKKQERRAIAKAEQEVAPAPKRKRFQTVVNQYNQRVCAVRINLEKQK